MPDAKIDMVNHPPHYNNHPSGIECIQITRHMNFNIGNAVKYLWRAGLKADPPPLYDGKIMLPTHVKEELYFGDKKKHIEDLKKSVWYINDEISRLEKLK